MPAADPLTSADLVNTLGRLIFDILDLKEGYDIAADSRVISAVAAANDLIYGYLRNRYKIPLDRRDAGLTSRAIDLARFDILQKYAPAKLDPLKDKDRYDEAIAYLKSAAKGEIAFTFPAQNEAQKIINPQGQRLGSGVTYQDKPMFANASWRDSL